MLWTFMKSTIHILWALFKTAALLIWVLISILAVVSFLMDIIDEDPKKMADKFVRKARGICLQRAFKSVIFYIKWEWKRALKEMK